MSLAPPPLPSPTRPSRRREVARGLVALATLVVLFGLVPVQLVAIGGAPWRWARAWPGWPALRQMLGRDGIPEAAYPSLLTGVAWILLIHLVFSALHELCRVVRHRPARGRGPATRTNGAPALPTPAAGVRHLVRSAALLVTTLAPTAPLTTAGPAARPAAVVRSAHPTSARVAPVRALPGRARPVPAGPRRVIARRWDTPYSLALAHLGDGARRHEVVALNEGRLLPDGSPFRGELQAGFEVVLPDGGGPVSPSPSGPADAPPARADGDDRGWTASSAVAGSTIVATGMAGLLLARRRRRLRSLRADQALPAPDPDLVPTETAVHRGADALGLARLDLALRLVARTTASPRPQWALRHRDGRLTIGFPTPAPSPPAPFTAGTTADRWELPATVGPAELVARTPPGAAPCPALVLLGTATAAPHRGAELYVDLEAVGLLALEGSPAQAAALARALVATLTVSPLAGPSELVVVGIDCYGLAHEPRVHHVGTIDDAVAVARALVVGGLAGPLPWARRPTADADTWAPAVVVAVRQPLHPEHAAALAALARGPAGGGAVAVVTDQPVADAVWRLHQAGTGRWRVAPLDLELEPCELAADELADLGALLTDAAAPAVPAALPPPTATPPSFTEPDWAFMVRLLGPVDVVTRHGTPVTFARGKALELVAWLGLHRGNATRTGARTALWETDVQHATFANVVSDARRALARAVAPADEHGWIARTYDERLPLHPGIVTDVGLVQARFEAARAQPVPAAIATLRPALVLVRDLPYSGTSWLWPDAEALPSAHTHLVTSAAAHLAHLLLQVGDAEGALWATAQGLRALPGHEELVCLRMRVHASTGDLTGVRHEYHSYERAVSNDPFGDGDVAAKVVGVRNELLAAARDQRLRTAPDAHSAARSSSV